MLNFTYENKCEIHFGKLSESHIAECIKKFGGKCVLLHYGGGSIKTTGLYNRVTQALAQAKLKVVELGGVRPNPSKTLAMQGIELARREKIDFILAIGGGSVIDSAKCIAAGVNQKDVWEFFEKKRDISELNDVLPIGAVLTIPAAGSECSTSCVIRNETDNLKYTIGSELIRPRFAFINPEYCSTLPVNQIANGASDIFAHLFERFFAEDTVTDAIVTDKILVGAMLAVLEVAPKVFKDVTNYNNLANLCLIGTLAHNGMLNMGRGRGCWASHWLDMTLMSGLKDIAHGEGLAISIPAYLKFMQKKKPARVEQFTREVIGVAGLEKFYKSIGLPTRLTDMKIDVAKILPLVESAFAGLVPLGGYGQLTIDEIKKIVELAK